MRVITRCQAAIAVPTCSLAVISGRFSFGAAKSRAMIGQSFKVFYNERYSYNSLRIEYCH